MGGRSVTGLPDGLYDWLSTAGRDPPTEAEPVSGGCISVARRLRFPDGGTLFLKTTDDCPPDLFAAEAAGLEALHVEGGPRVPTVHLHGADFIVMEDLPPGSPRPNYWAAFGIQMASLHEHHGPHFGFERDTYCGATLQPNPATDDGHAFFAEHRLLFQARLARDAGHLDREGVRLIERVCHRLDDRIPPQPASVLHGDLWSGNAHVGPQGEPALVDPAAHWGWAEAELAMTLMFGSFGADFYAAYADHRPLADDWRDRVDLYNLYHQLNHLNLFGESYRAGVYRMARSYA